MQNVDHVLGKYIISELWRSAEKSRSEDCPPPSHPYMTIRLTPGQMCKVLLECINRFRPVVVTCLSEEGFTTSTYHAVAALLGFDEQNGRALLSILQAC